MKTFVVVVEDEYGSEVVNVYSDVKKAKEEILKRLYEFHEELGLTNKNDSEEMFISRYIDNLEENYDKLADPAGDSYNIYCVEKDLIN